MVHFLERIEVDPPTKVFNQFECKLRPSDCMLIRHQPFALSQGGTFALTAWRSTS